MSVNTSVWTQQQQQQNKSVYSTKTQPVITVNNNKTKQQHPKRQGIINCRMTTTLAPNNHNRSQLIMPKNHNRSRDSTSTLHKQQQSKHLQQQQLLNNNNPQQPSQTQKLDTQFVTLLKQLQEYYTTLTKHQQIRVQKWIVKIIQNDENIRWKHNRNNYLRLLVHIVKTNHCLLQPFDKIPDDKGLTYMSQHQFSQRTQPRFDGRSPVFHLHKPQIIKISEPKGDNCSVLMSIVNTARTYKDKENVVLIENVDVQQERCDNKIIKQSQLIEYHHNQLSSKVSKKSINNNQHKNINNEQGKQPQPHLSSVIPSYLPSHNPSQVKSITPYSHSSNSKSLFSKKEKHISQNNNNNTHKQQKSISVQKQYKTQQQQKYNYHQKYSVRNSIVQNSHFVHKHSLNSSHLLHNNNKNTNNNKNNEQLLKVYKQLVHTMGRLLLKHQFAIQKQSQYWQLMRMIYSYQCSLKNSFNSSPTKLVDKGNKNIQSNIKSQRLGEKGVMGENKESFEQFLSRLREEIGQSVVGVKNVTSQSNRHNNQINNQSSLLLQQKHHLQHHQPHYQNKNFIYTNTNNTNNNNINHQDQQTINHITQQSLDFRVQQGAQQQDMLYYELGDVNSNINRRRQSMNFNVNHNITNTNNERQQQLHTHAHSHLIIDERVSQIVECDEEQNNFVMQQKLLSSQQMMNNSLMQISDSYREIRRKGNDNKNNDRNSRNNRIMRNGLDNNSNTLKSNNINLGANIKNKNNTCNIDQDYTNHTYKIQKDYHNVYDQSQQQLQQQQEEISFTNQQLIDDDGQYFSDRDDDQQQGQQQQYHHQQQQQQQQQDHIKECYDRSPCGYNNNVRYQLDQQASSPQFTDIENDDDQQQQEQEQQQAYIEDSSYSQPTNQHSLYQHQQLMYHAHVHN